jgi:phosphoribosylglycinamide formyltransferase-1
MAHIGEPTLQNSINVIIMASGTGSNATNLIQYAKKKLTNVNICAVITDNPNAGIIERCDDLEVNCYIVPFERVKSLTYEANKLEHEQKILEIADSYKADWIMLAGYMRILSSDFIFYYRDENLGASRVINIHPALLPDFKGKDGYEQAFAANVPESGVTVHLVDAGIDTGPILLQEKFKRIESDTLEDFKSRGLKIEHKLYPQILELIENKNIKLQK